MIILYGNEDSGAACKTASKVISAQGGTSIPVWDTGASVFANPAADPLPYSGQLILEGNTCHWIAVSIVYAVWDDCDACTTPDEITLEKMQMFIPPKTKVWALPNAYISEIAITVVDGFEWAGLAATKEIGALYTSQYTLGCCEEVKVS